MKKMTDSNKIDMFETITKSMCDLFRRKNSDYGNSFEKTHDEYGIVAFLIRCQDKINRLNSINKKGKIEVSDESVTDTLKDIANYAVMTIIELENDKIKNGSETLKKQKSIQYVGEDQ